MKSHFAKIASGFLLFLFAQRLIYGMDMALDQNGRIWIIEANLFPSRSHFRLLADKTMFQRITAYRQMR
jgi:hypothetical protein